MSIESTFIAEIVTFRLKPGSSPAEFVATAANLADFLKSTGALRSRHLSCDDTGLWTDHITWTSMEAAKTVANDMFARPEAAPFMALIDTTDLKMRHAPLALHWE
ncbi:MAG: hypothetical protein WBC93_21670 [Sulfitobacter sp.]